MSASFDMFGTLTVRMIICQICNSNIIITIDVNWELNFDPISSNKFFAKISFFANLDVAYYSASLDDSVTFLPAIDIHEISAPQKYRT
jgi:hypothetical protein